MAPAAARRRALAVILEDEHHREPDKQAAPAHPAGGNRFAGQPSVAHAAPEGLPGLSAPKRNACSQAPLRPRRLWVIGASLHATRVAAACRLRQSGRRDRGPVTLPRSGCPDCRSHHPAALPNPSSRHSPRHSAVAPRASAAGHVRRTPCHILQLPDSRRIKTPLPHESPV